jgi:hypothetical protein
MIDTSAPKHALPPCLWIPIAAADRGAIECHVGRVIHTLVGRSGRVEAFKVESSDHAFQRDPRVRLWKHPRAEEFAKRLHPQHQVWVHVDFDGYRGAYIDACRMPPFPADYFLDHVQNRRAIRARGYTHPYLRLCPVSRRVNTSGGHQTGGEGLEREYLEALPRLPASQRAAAARAMSSRVVYADPMDLTKMLDIEPGTGILSGVRDTQLLFFPG